jgi:hypothetical protein
MNEEEYLKEIANGRIGLPDIPEGQRTEKIYMAAVQQDWQALMSVPEDKLTDEICLAAVYQNTHALLDIPDDKLTEKLCLAIVKLDGLALGFFDDKICTEEICLAAVKQNGQALMYVPEDKLTDEICLAAVQQDWRALKLVPENKCKDEWCLAAVKKDWHLLEYIPETRRKEAVCLEAMQQDSEALKFIPETLKEHIIQQLSISTIFANNYLAHQHFPVQPDLTSDIKQFLQSVNCVVVSNPSEIDVIEVRDARLTYIDKKKNKAAVSITTKNLISLLDDLKQAGNQTNLDIVFIGHAHEDIESLAGFDYKSMAALCASHPTIKNIHLLGCNAAKAKQPAAEKEMVDAFSRKMDEKEKLKYGLMTALNASQNNQAFQKKCLEFCMKNNLDGVYVINKTETAYQLFSLKIDPANKNQLKEKIRDLPAGRISGEKLLWEDGKEIKFSPLKKAQQNWGLLTIRDKEPLDANKLDYIRGLIDEAERFDKSHHKYKEDKTRYPFLAKVEADPEDLLPSLLKKLADEIKANANIKWDITLHAPTKAVHVDTAQRDFKIARTHLYTDEYKHSHFFGGTGNIDYKKLKQERKGEMKDMRDKPAGDNDSKARQIKVTIKK